MSTIGYINGLLLNSKKKWIADTHKSMRKYYGHTKWKMSNMYWIILFIWSCRIVKINLLVVEFRLIALGYSRQSLIGKKHKEPSGVMWMFYILYHVIIIHRDTQLIKLIQLTLMNHVLLYVDYIPHKYIL